jgi:hypothetical protein
MRALSPLGMGGGSHAEKFFVAGKKLDHVRLGQFRLLGHHFFGHSAAFL